MNVTKTCNELGSKKYYKILISIEVIIMYVTYHLKRSLAIIMELIYVCFFLVWLVYKNIVNAFYFHKYSNIFELDKCD